MTRILRVYAPDAQTTVLPVVPQAAPKLTRRARGERLMARYGVLMGGAGGFVLLVLLNPAGAYR